MNQRWMLSVFLAAFNFFSFPLFGNWPATRTTDSLFLLAVSSRNEFMYPEAVRYLEQVLTIDSLHIAAMEQMADLHQKIGHTAQSRYFWKKIASADTSRVYPRVNLALLEMAEQNYTQAIALLTPIAERQPSNSAVLRYLARCYELADSASQAFDTYGALLKIIPDDENAAFRALNMAIRSKRYADGIRLAKEFTIADTTRLEVNRQYGYLLLLDNQNVSSVQIFQQCRRLGDSTFLPTNTKV